MKDDNFDKPLGEWIEEEHEVPIMEGKFENGKLVGVQQGTTTRKVKTMYSKVTPQKFSCKDGTHLWRMLDKGRGVAKCQNCTKHRFLRAPFDFIDKEGALRNRDTGELID